MSVLDRSAFLAPVKVKVERIHCPELGGDVFVRGMTAKDRSTFEKQFQQPNGKPSKRKLQEIRERLTVWCLCDEEGTPLLTEADLDAVGAQPAPVIERIVNAGQRLCGMSNEDMELMAGNSEETNEAN